MSTSKLTDEETEEYIEENAEGISKRSWTLLKTENEKHRQEVYSLRRKLELNETMLREVQEANETLERTLDKRISEKDKIIFAMEEKYRNIIKEYENTISNQATEIEELKQKVDQHLETECVTTAADELLNLSFETANTSLNNQIEGLLLMLEEEKERYKNAEDTIEELKSRCNELEHHSKEIKEQLNEKARLLEDMRAELSLRHAEKAALESDPMPNTCKGNSLFAEVEDRRRNVIDKMNTMREKYSEMKRLYKLQATEIKMLRAERIAALRKWENDAGDMSAMNDELIKKLKNRISDLENKLKLEIKNNNTKKENYPDVASFEYCQTLMYAKNKEMDQLRIKIEDLSTKMLVQEETKLNTIKQLQYWRHKASTLEAQIAAIQAESKLDLMNDEECAVLNE
ncbi:protein Spindly-like [Osmia bicornis bicornis]|uniref:protein Spindly-like n=1 Tax=Osmia bicornis bicornis TaxID=1437191 RepID=UPI0010F838CE|nr:protein Spindly-like [Osmia bicornis bicornis]